MKETILELLCAPLTHAALRLADAVELGEINSQDLPAPGANRDGSHTRR